MEIENDVLHVFKDVILFEETFRDTITNLEDQLVNELSINELEDLVIEFKGDSVRLSSSKPFYLCRARERLIINHKPALSVSVWGTFLKTYCSSSRMFRDQIEAHKVYTNRYKDEAYMESLNKANNSITTNPTPLEGQISFITAEHKKQIDMSVIDELLKHGLLKETMYSGWKFTKREAFGMTLSGSMQGYITDEEMALFKEAREAYEQTNAYQLAATLFEELEAVKRWGSLGEQDMLDRAKNDVFLCSSYNECNAVKRTEWILQGSELHQLRFFNLKGKSQDVDFYNRNKERPIAYGSHPTLLPYEHMRVVKRGEKIGLSYTIQCRT